MPVIGMSALTVIYGLPWLVIRCLSIYYSTLERKLARRLWITLLVLFVLCCCGCVRDGWPLLPLPLPLPLQVSAGKTQKQFSHFKDKYLQMQRRCDHYIQTRDIHKHVKSTKTETDDIHTHTHTHTFFRRTSHLEQNPFLGTWDGTVNVS